MRLLGLAGLLGFCLPAAAARAAGDAAPTSAADWIARAELAMRTDAEASRAAAQSALKLLETQPDPNLAIQARLVLCQYHAERDRNAALAEIARARALLPNASRTGLAAGLLTCEGEVREAAGETPRAKALFDEAVRVAGVTHDDEMLAEALFSRGYLLGVGGNYAAGMADLRRAQVLFDRLGKQLHSLTVLDSIAILYNRMGDYAQAQRMYAQTLTAQRAAGLLNDEAVTLYNLGRTEENQQEWRDAAQSFTESLTLSERIGYTRGQAYALRGLASVANAEGNPTQALQQLGRAGALAATTTDERLRGHIGLARGIALHRLHRLPESRKAIEEALAIFRSFDALSELGAAERELAGVLADLNEWQSAYDHTMAYADVEDRLRRRQLDQRFATLKVEFDTAATAKQNEILMRQAEVDRKALEQGRAVRRLQAAVEALTVLLAAALALLALYQRRSSMRMRALAMTDELTGVPNRRAVLGRLGALLKDPQCGVCGMLIIDIDHFKSINDHHGHPAGDEVLKLVAEQVRTAVPSPSFFGRLGGEEFLVVLPDVTLERAVESAELFRTRISEIDMGRWFGDRRAITASIGLTVSTPGVDTPSTMLKRADAALYNAKRSGRNCVRIELSPAQGLRAAAPHAPRSAPGAVADSS